MQLPYPMIKIQVQKAYIKTNISEDDYVLGSMQINKDLTFRNTYVCAVFKMRTTAGDYCTVKNKKKKCSLDLKSFN